MLRLGVVHNVDVQELLGVVVCGCHIIGCVIEEQVRIVYGLDKVLE